MHGPLDEIGLVEVLQLLARGERNGVLQVTGGDVLDVHEIHLAKGVIVGIHPDADDERTHAALVRQCLIAADDPRDDETMTSPLARAMRLRLAVQALAAMVRWRSGRFDFVTATATGPLALAPDRVLFDLVDLESRRVELAEVTDEFRAVPVYLPAESVERGEPVQLSAMEWRLLQLVDGRRDLRTLAAFLDASVEDVASSVLRLQGAAILEVHRPSVPAWSAEAALASGHYVDAAERLRVRLAETPDDAAAWRALGLAEIGAGRFADAIDAWQHWQDRDPDHAGDAVTLVQAARTMVEALREPRD